MYENKDVEERVILFAVRQKDDDDTDSSLVELAELADCVNSFV